MDPDPAIFVFDLQDVSKKLAIQRKVFLFINVLFEGTFTYFSKIKSQEEVTKQ
jgi:hypothetical protein